LETQLQKTVLINTNINCYLIESTALLVKAMSG
jgi:hypothetical protein